MGALTILMTTIIGVLLAAFASQLASEFRDWTPRWTEWLIDRAVSRLPVDLQERMAEEWREFVLEAPGHIVKLRRALGLSRAARRVASDLSNKVTRRFWSDAISRTIGGTTLGVLAPVFILVLVACAIRGGPIFEKTETANFYRFRISGDDNLSRVLRRSYIAELPSLWSMVRGDLTLSWPQTKNFLSDLLFRIRSGR